MSAWVAPCVRSRIFIRPKGKAFSARFWPCRENKARRRILKTARPATRFAPMKILYLGEDVENSSCLHRARALRRLGHEVVHLNPDWALTSGRWAVAWNFRTGYRFCRRRVARFILRSASASTYDIVWVDGGRAVSPDLLRTLRWRCQGVINYNLDDPFGRRDGRCCAPFRRSVREYDVLCVVRAENVNEARRHGAKRILRVWRGYDPIAHAPRSLTAVDRRQWSSDVLFIGTWMPERGGLLAELIRRGVPVTIYGDRWERAPEWSALRRAWRGSSILGADYVKAI